MSERASERASERGAAGGGGGGGGADTELKTKTPHVNVGNQSPTKTGIVFMNQEAKTWC